MNLLSKNWSLNRKRDILSKVKDLKHMNIQKVRQCFYDGNIWTKTQLSDETQLSLSSMTNILQELLKNQEIFFIGENASTGGRKSKQYVLNKDYRHILKMILKRQINGYEFICQNVNLFNQVISSQTVSSMYGQVDELILLMKKFLSADSSITMICLSIPGVCHDGYIDVCDFELFENVNLLEMIRDFYKNQIILENDVNIASIGFYHQYPKCQHLAFVYQPAVQYIGCGMIINGKLYNGFTHFAGELRYLPFYTSEQQNQMLETQPKELLEKQLSTLCCVFNPEMIGICSDVIDCLDDFHLNTIPFKHRPRMIHVKNMDSLIEDGLYQMCIQKILEEGKNDDKELY